MNPSIFFSKDQRIGVYVASYVVSDEHRVTVELFQGDATVTLFIDGQAAYELLARLGDSLKNPTKLRGAAV